MPQHCIKAIEGEVVKSRSVHLTNFRGGGQVIALKTTAALIIDRIQTMKELHSYIFESNLDEALKLIQEVKGINEEYGIGIRPIISAINSDNPECLRFVIEQGADVNIDDGMPLHDTIDFCIDGMILDVITAYSHNDESFERLKSIFRPLIPT